MTAGGGGANGGAVPPGPVPGVPPGIPPGIALRGARPDDYDPIAAVLPDWWGRPVLSGLPRLFLDQHFRSSLVAEDRDGLVGFLVGLLPPDPPDQAYVHFVGVAPRARRHGLARILYEEFFALARHAGRARAAAITAPLNAASIAFHRRLGFTVSEPVPDYNGPGRDMVLFSRPL